MMNEIEQKDLDITFTGVFIYKKNHLVVTAVVDEYAEKNLDHTIMFYRTDNQWKHRLMDNSISSVCFVEEPKLKILNMGVNGEITVATLPGVTTEQVDSSSEQGPSYSVLLRCIKKIGNHVYVAGMARRVYRRDAPEKWVAIDQDVFVPREQRKSAIGFNCLDGFHEKSIYAVGYKGEIWVFSGKNWVQQESPTNIVLTRVKCIPSGEVYICGMAGIILRGSADRWIIIEQDITKEDFWGISYFQNQVYLSNYDGVFVLDDDDLIPVDMKLSSKVSTAYIDANEEVLWSVGEKDSVYTEDGNTWVVIENP